MSTGADMANVAPGVVRPTVQRALAVGLDLKAAGAAGLLEPAGDPGT